MKNSQNSPKTAIIPQKFSNQEFISISVYVKLFPYDCDLLAVEEGYEGLNEFKWNGKLCIDYGCNSYFHIGIADTIESVYTLIDKFNNDLGLEFGLDQFQLECNSIINL
jgi:hypothetical protein